MSPCNAVVPRLSLLGSIPLRFTNQAIPHLSKCCRSLDGEDLLRALWHTMRKREFEVFRDELFDVWTLDLIGSFEFNHFEDVDRPEPSTMSSCHILVEGLDCVGP
jgi:hypothetical protein